MFPSSLLSVYVAGGGDKNSPEIFCVGTCKKNLENIPGIWSIAYGNTTNYK